MRKIVTLALVLAFIFTFLAIPATASTFAEKLINSWKDDLRYVEFIESWYKEYKGLEGDALTQYLEKDYEYKIPLKDVEFDDIEGLKCQDAVLQLGKLGIVTGREEGKYFPLASLTRAEMVTILLRVFGQEEYKGNFKFDDVTDTHWAFNNIMMAYGMKIVNGTSENTFSPDLALTYEQAVKMLVSAFGYDEEATELGGWPNGYIEQAEKMGFLGATKPEDTASEINRGTMAQLLANSLEISEYAIDYVDPYNSFVALKNAPESIAKISFDIPMIKTDRTVVSPDIVCNEWDTLAVLQCKVDKEVVGTVLQDYLSADKSLRNPEAWKLAETEKLRMIYGMKPTSEQFNFELGDKLIDAGINLVCVTFLGGHEEYDNFSFLEERLDAFDEYCKEHPEVKIVISQQCGTGDHNTQFGKYNTGTETLFENSPCPLSEEYWKKHCFEKFAFIATHPSIYAIAFDWEMYGADSTHFPGSCFCDNCWNDFLITRGYTDANLKSTDAAERKAVITEEGLLQEYDWYQRETLISMLQKWVKALHDINPNLVLGYLPQYEEIKGITRGLGTPQMPVLCFDEKTYWGNVYNVASNIEGYSQAGSPVVQFTGLWNNPIPPETFTKFIEYISYNTDGYWVYSSDFFKDDANYSYQSSDNIPRSGAMYREALAEGNALIDKFLSTGSTVPPSYLVTPEYTCEKVNSEPTQNDWDKAEWTELFGKNDIHHDPGKEISTKAKMLWDGKNLYVQIHNFDPYMNELNPSESFERDKLSWAGQEINEVFWKFTDSVEGIHLAANRDAHSIYDSCITAVGEQDPTYNFDVEVSTETFDDKWVMTLRVPLSVDGIRTAKSGESLKVLLSRYRQHSSEAGNWCWGSVLGTYITSTGLWGTIYLK